MKILFYSANPLLDFFSSTGYGTHMQEWVAALRRAGHTVEVLTMRGNSDTSIGNVSKGKTNFLKKFVPGFLWESLRVFLLMKKDQQSRKLLEKKIEEFSPDMLYERSCFYSDSGLKCSENRGFIYVLECNSPLSERKIAGNFSTIWESRFEKLEAKRALAADLLVVVSENLKDYFTKKTGIPIEKVVATPNGINLSKVKVKAGLSSQLKKQFKLEGKKVLGFIGTFSNWQKLVDLVYEFEEISKNHPEFRLLLLGDGVSYPEVKSTIRKLGLEETVFIPGLIPFEDVFNYMEIMDFALIPGATWYSSPIKLFEYGSMGKTVISVDVGPVREIISHMETGYIIEEGSGGLKKAVEVLLANPELAESMGAKLKKLIISENTWDSVYDRVFNRINQIVTTRKC